MNDGHELHYELRQFTGSEKLYRHSLVRAFTYTEGVQFFARNAGGGAYWLLDILATEPAIKRLVQEEGFASVRLSVPPQGGALLTVDDGNGNVKFVREMGYTDCPTRPVSTLDPEGVWLFFIEPNVLGDGTTAMTMMLPSERRKETP